LLCRHAVAAKKSSNELLCRAPQRSTFRSNRFQVYYHSLAFSSCTGYCPDHWGGQRPAVLCRLGRPIISDDVRQRFAKPSRWRAKEITADYRVPFAYAFFRIVRHVVRLDFRRNHRQIRHCRIVKNSTAGRRTDQIGAHSFRFEIGYSCRAVYCRCFFWLHRNHLCRHRRRYIQC